MDKKRLLKVDKKFVPPQDDEDDELLDPVDPITLDELIICLKRLQKSAQTWTRRAGRKGYLDFIKQFM